MADQQEASSSRIDLDNSEPQPEISESSSAAEAPQKKCAGCSKLETVTDPEEQAVLKPCSKCHTTLYCSRDCTKSDFKQHKKVCAKQAQAYAESTEFKPSVRRAPPKENFRGGLQKWQFDT